MSYVSDAPMNCVGYEQKTVSSASTTFTASNYVPTDGRPSANYVLLKVASGAIRFRMDGTDPSATVGFPLSAGDQITIPCNPGDIEMIRQSADSVVEALFFRW